MLALETKDLVFSYPGQTSALKFPDVSVHQGERVFVFGPSGCGKTTFLSLVTGLLRPSGGGLSVFGTSLDQLSAPASDQFRAENMGVIFQQFNLLPYLSVTENISLADQFTPAKVDSQGWLLALLSKLNLDTLKHRKVRQLSVGEQQRVALARALYRKPRLIIADEPTSSLDADRRDAFLALLFSLCDEVDCTVLFVSHDRNLEKYFTRSLSLTTMKSNNYEIEQLGR